MNRRDILRDAIVASAFAAGLGVSGASASTSEPLINDVNGETDRRVDRDPMAVQHSTLVVDGLDPSALRVEYLDLLNAGGVNCWHRDGGHIADFAAMLSFCDQHQDKIVPVTTVRAIHRAQRDGKIAHISGWQSADPLIADGGDDGPAIGNLRAYHELGLRICGVAFNVANDFGAGCAEPHIGLTLAGHRLVDEIHRLQIVLDVGGHTGEQTSLDAIAMSSGVPVVCTHTNARTLVDNPRNTSDKVFEAIAKTGGVIGVTAFNDFHARTRADANVPRTPQVGLNKHLDQYDYLRRLVGVDHIGLGPDFDEPFARMNTGRMEPVDRFPPEAYSELPWLYVKGFENISELPNVTRGLIDRGWSTAELHKVLGGNWLRVYESVWGA